MTQQNIWTNPGRPLQLLVVEDEPKLAVLVCRYLDAAGFQTGILADGRLVVNAVRTNPPDLVLLDLMLPGRDGIDICREIRTFSSVPIIMMTARVEEIDRLLGLELGADDYICKPFSPREMVARVRAVLRRSSGKPAGQDSDGVRLDALSRRAFLGDQELQLTVKEFDLLRVLIREQGKVVSREQLMREVWDTQWFGSTKTLDMHVSVLRKKLGDDVTRPRFITTVRGVGFRFERPEDAA